MKNLKQIPVILVLLALFCLVPAGFSALADTPEDDWNYTNQGTYIYLKGYAGAGGAVELPAELEDLPVTTISRGALTYNSSGGTITSVTVPADFTASLGAGPFFGNNSIEQISVDSESTKYMSQDGVLFNKEGTTLLVYPGGKSGSVYTIPDGVTAIETYAMAYNTLITELIFPESLTNIDSYAFRCATGLTTVSLPSGVTTMGYSAFYECTSLTSVTIPYGITTLERDVFAECTSLTSVALPDSLTTIGKRTFGYCTALAQISIPYTVTSIDTYAFYYCDSSLVIRGMPGSVVEDYAVEKGFVFESLDISEMPPIHTAVASTRTSVKTAEVTFFTTEEGEYYFAVVEDGEAEPAIDTSVDGIACAAGDVLINVTGMTEGAKDIYIAVKDVDGLVGNVLMMNIHEYVDTTPPVLTGVSYDRISDTEVTVVFSTNEPATVYGDTGTYYYVVVDGGDDAPTTETVMAGTSGDMVSGENTFTLEYLTRDAYDVYIVGEDVQGNVSDVLKMEIIAFPITPEDFEGEAMPVKAGTSSILLTWTAPGDATEYEIYKSTSQGDLLDSDPRTLGGGAYYTYANGLDADTTYYFAIQAINSVGTGEIVYSAPVTTQSPGAAMEDTITVTKIAGYSTGTVNESGGVAEMVEFNKDNSKFYIVNGSTSPATLEIVPLPATGYPSYGVLGLSNKTTIDIESLLAGEISDFTFGDLSAVAMSTVNDKIYLAVQEDDYCVKNGIILVLDYDGNYVHQYEAGFGPDMVTVSKDGRYILTADEGEPGNYSVDNDPKGSVTIVDTMGTADTADDTVTHVYFDDTSKIDDDVHIRGVENDSDSVVMVPRDKSDAVTDFEPEFIALSEDGSKAYVSLQENNAIAVIDVAAKALVSVKSLGYKDLLLPENAIDVIEDQIIALENLPAYGMYMPDAIVSYKVNGKTYIFTANEGDVAEYFDNDTTPRNIAAYLTGQEAANFFYPTSNGYIPSGIDGEYYNFQCAADMGPEDVFIFGARSFSIWDADTMA